MSYVGFKLSDEEKNQLEEAARQSGKNISTYLRDLAAADYNNIDQMAELNYKLIDLQDTLKKHEKLLFFLRNHVFRIYEICFEFFALTHDRDAANQSAKSAQRRLSEILKRIESKQRK